MACYVILFLGSLVGSNVDAGTRVASSARTFKGPWLCGTESCEVSNKKISEIYLFLKDRRGGEAMLKDRSRYWIRRNNIIVKCE